MRDIKQSSTLLIIWWFFRSNHHNRAMVTLFWVFCPMVVKLVLDLFKWTKDTCKNGFSACLCGCEAFKVRAYIKKYISWNLAQQFYFGILQEKENEGFWVKWTHFSIKGSFWVHIPILQPLVHCTFFKKLISLDNKIQENKKKYTDFAANLDTTKELEYNTKEAFKYGQTNHNLLKRKNTLLATFLDLKLLEAFLEAGPQFAFQLSIILQDGLSGYTQMLTVVTSALSLTWASSELYLKYPTEVCIYIILWIYSYLPNPSFFRNTWPGNVDSWSKLWLHSLCFQTLLDELCVWE